MTAKTKLLARHRASIVDYAFRVLDDPALVANELSAIAVMRTEIERSVDAANKATAKEMATLAKYGADETIEVDTLNLWAPRIWNGKQVLYCDMPHSENPFLLDNDRPTSNWDGGILRLGQGEADEDNRGCMRIRRHPHVFRTNRYQDFNRLATFSSGKSILKSLVYNDKLGGRQRGGGNFYLNNQEIKLKHKGKTYYCDDFESPLIDAAANQAIKAAFIAAHDRWHKKLELMKTVIHLLRNATHLEDVEAAWPEAKAIRVELIGDPGIKLPAPVYDIAALQANSMARGVVIEAEAPEAKE